MTSPLTEAFEAAKREFLSSTKPGSHDFSRFTSIKEVYDATDKIQRERSKSGTLRNLRRIEPYLDCLRHYAEVIETFVQAKPDILALIWGPLKLILLATKTYVKGYEKIWEIMAQVGIHLPQFEKYVEVFNQDAHMKRFLSLFYKDILDFHSTLLEFFHLNKTQRFFEALWPKYSSKIQVIIDNITKHRSLMDNQVNLTNIVEAEAARAESYRVFEQIQDSQLRADFEQVRSVLSPNMYDDEIERIQRNKLVPNQTKSWLEELSEFQEWVDPACSSSRLLWLQGIPGAGKSFLASHIVVRMKCQGDSLAFAFLSYRARLNDPPLNVLHTFMVQLAVDNKILQPAVSLAYRENSRDLSNSTNFVINLVKQMLEILPTTYFILDGLDEVLEAERRYILEIMLKLHEEHENLKLLICSRPERDIVRILNSKVEPIRVESGNSQGIKAYVQQRSNNWLSGLTIDPEDKAEINALMGRIIKSSQGMFLYARLVCDNLELQSDVDMVKAEINNLPSGLDEAYGRIVSRITKDLQPQTQIEARQILEWVSCSLDPVTKNEIQLALMIASGKDPSHGFRGNFMDIFQRCGPIIEESNGYIHFVHFSAREFLLHAQSGPYLTEANAHANIGSVCIQFLLSHIFDEDISDDVTRASIVSGSFLLENYTCRRWFDHVMKSIESVPEVIRHDFECLLEKRENYDFGANNESNPAKKGLKVIPEFSEELRTIIINLDRFWKSRRRNFCFTKIENWENLDPFTISKRQAQIRQIFADMLCSGSVHIANCSCVELQALYGSHIYGCSRPGCARFRNGFKSKEESENHIQAHYRPFKCDFIDCPYYDLGFSSTSRLQNHIGQFHQNSTAKSDSFGQLVEAKAILQDAIDLDDLNLVRDMHVSVRTHSGYLIKTCLMRGSSPDMLRLILQICKSHKIVLHWSWYLDWLKEKPNGDPELFRIVMERGIIKVGDFDDIAHTSSVEMFELFAEYGAVVRNYQKFFRKLLPVRSNALAEINALKCMKVIESALDIRGYETCLVALSDRSCSISIARFCLEHGASVDAAMAQGRASGSPLEKASSKTSSEAVQFVELLREYQAR